MTTPPNESSGLNVSLKKKRPRNPLEPQELLHSEVSQTKQSHIKRQRSPKTANFMAKTSKKIATISRPGGTRNAQSLSQAKKRVSYKHELLSLKNVGKATLSDLQRLGINSIKDLSVQDPKMMFEALAILDGKLHDPCS
jgi:nucleotidyltransferase/DNA polymerase involved in DNA repair